MAKIPYVYKGEQEKFKIVRTSCTRKNGVRAWRVQGYSRNNNEQPWLTKREAAACEREEGNVAVFMTEEEFNQAKEVLK